jgi:hypothetical protein
MRCPDFAARRINPIVTIEEAALHGKMWFGCGFRMVLPTLYVDSSVVTAEAE